MQVDKAASTFVVSSAGPATVSSSGSEGTGDFRAALQDAYQQTGYQYQSRMPVIDNPLSPAAWPDRFSARMENAAGKLGMRVNDVKAKFAAISQRAAEEGGFAEPGKFLKSLSEEDREFLQISQGGWKKLSDGKIDGLSHEGALNLLLPPGAQRDFNGDGFYKIGEGTTFHFPPDSAPQAMKDAWASHLEDLPEGERLMAEGYFLPLIVSGNLEYNDKGQAVNIYGPEDAGYNNPFADAAFSFRGHAQARLAFLEANRGMFGEEQYQRDTKFWNGLVDKMSEFGVA